MLKGTVKWFNNMKGYGFIVAEGDTRDIFVHYTSVQSSGFKTLFRDQGVEFELVTGERGPYAANVKILDSEFSMIPHMEEYEEA